MSVDEALTYIVSMGVIVPGGSKNPNLKAVAPVATCDCLMIPRATPGWRTC